MLNLIADVLLIATGQGPTTRRNDRQESWNDRCLPRQMQDETRASYRCISSSRGQNWAG